MDLPTYITQIGVEEFAKKFGIPPRTALAYQKQTRRPRPQLAQKIVDRTPVTWEGIYSPRKAALAQPAAMA